MGQDMLAESPAHSDYSDSSDSDSELDSDEDSEEVAGGAVLETPLDDRCKLPQ